MQFNFVNDNLRVEEQAEIKYKLVHITYGLHTTNINICKTLYLLEEPIMWFLKWLEHSQEILSFLRARSTHSADRVQSKLVETAFKLCSSAVVNSIVY